MQLEEIIVIDDSSTDLLFGDLVLERSGVARRVRTFEFAQAALHYLQEPAGREVDLILLDINMPNLDGFAFLEVFDELRVKLGIRAVVVMLTASLDPLERERAYRFPCVKHYLEKPLTLHEARALASLSSRR